MKVLLVKAGKEAAERKSAAQSGLRKLSYHSSMVISYVTSSEEESAQGSCTSDGQGPRGKHHLKDLPEMV